MTPELEAGAFRAAIGRFATGVTVITVSGTDGPAGLTTNAVTSLSLQPPLLLVCLDNASRTLPVVLATRRFAVNILAEGQEELAVGFASKRVAREKFESVAHSVAHGVPVLDGALAWLACDLTATHPGGDHTIAIGSVTHASALDGEPLLFHAGAYR